MSSEAHADRGGPSQDGPDAAASNAAAESTEELAGPALDLDGEAGTTDAAEDALEPTAATGSPVDATWELFKATGDRNAREVLILHYAPLVTMVANRVGAGLPTSVEQSDLVSYGMFGLIDAIEKYETDRAVKFETYASSRIRGAIIDELRAIDWIPRSVRTKARAVDRAFAELESELHRAPSEDEVADRLSISVARAARGVLPARHGQRRRPGRAARLRLGAR